MNKRQSLCLLATLVSYTISNAAIVSNGDFNDDPGTFSNTSGAVGYFLDGGNVLNAGQSPYSGTADTSKDVNQWFVTTVNGAPDFDSTGGVGGTGGMVMTAASNTDNKPRSILQFAQDDGNTTGIISIEIDFKFSRTGTGMFGNIELYGWNTGQTAPILSIGGATGNSTTYNATVLGDAVDLLSGINAQIPASGFTADEWDTATIAGIDLGTGYDFYAWRIGVVGADTTLDVASFDNLVIVPEPSAYALLAGFLGLMYVASRRRR